MALAVASVANATPTAGLSISCSKPTGTVSGDLLILQLTQVQLSNNPVQAFTPPSGWTSIRTDGASGNTRNSESALYYLVAGAAEPSNYISTITDSGNNGAFGASIARITGTTAGPSIPSAQNGQAVSGYTTSLSYSISITPPDASSLLLYFITLTQNHTTSAYSVATSNPSWTQQWDVTASPNSNIGYAMASAVRVQTTATGTATATSSGTDASGESVGQMISIFQAPSTVTSNALGAELLMMM